MAISNYRKEVRIAQSQTRVRVLVEHREKRGQLELLRKGGSSSKGSPEMACAKLSTMNEAGANCSLVLCPACLEQLDNVQVEIRRRMKRGHGLPVLHLAQFTALVLAATPGG